MLNTILVHLGGMAGALLMTLAGIISVLCLRVWLSVVAFAERWWWGVALLLDPSCIGSIVFAYYRWEKAKTAFLTGVMFLVLAILLFIARAIIGLYPFTTESFEDNCAYRAVRYSLTI